MFLRRSRRRQEVPACEGSQQGEDVLLRKQLLAFEAVSARHSAHITIMWQAPSLGVAAESFLLTIALSPGSPTATRIGVSVLGMMVALLASQLMAKHRYASQRDGQILESLVRRLDMAEVFNAAANVKSTWLSRRSSYLSWRIGLGIFLVFNIAILVLSIVRPEVFGVPAVSPRR
jgi:hypothetical protein